MNVSNPIENRNLIIEKQKQKKNKKKLRRNSSNEITSSKFKFVRTTRGKKKIIKNGKN